MVGLWSLYFHTVYLSTATPTNCPEQPVLAITTNINNEVIQLWIIENVSKGLYA